METKAFFLIGDDVGPDDCVGDVDGGTATVVSAVTSGRKSGAMLLAELLLPRSLWILLLLLELEPLDMIIPQSSQPKGMDLIGFDNICNG